LKTLQAIFDSSQGFLNAILFVFFSSENMTLLSQSLCGTHSWLMKVISCGRWSQQGEVSTGEDGAEGGHRNDVYDESSSYYLSHSGRPDHSSDLINGRLFSLEEQQQRQEEEDEDDEEVEGIAWDGQLSYQRNNPYQDTTTSRQIKCSFTEG
jgi:hypothetical protein